jgi:hypothetical protein
MWDPRPEKVFTTHPWGRYPLEDPIGFVTRNFYSQANRAAVRFLKVGFATSANLWFFVRERLSANSIDGSPAAAAMVRERLDKE